MKCTMYLGFPCQLRATLCAVACKVRATLGSCVFTRVWGHGVDVTLVDPHVFRPFILNGVKKKIVPDYMFHEILFKLNCLEIACIRSRFTV